MIPTLNPPSNFPKLTSLLEDRGFSKILVINDGSHESKSPIFRAIEKEGIKIIHLSKNMGKGAALKTGYQYIHDMADKNIEWVLACDDDGQHSLFDIEKIALKATQVDVEKRQVDLILGCRSFDKDIPFKSYIGYLFFKLLFMLFYFKKLSDTQTGLRCVRSKRLYDLVKISGMRFSFETLCLQYFLKNKLNIEEVPIETIYVQNNISTRFKAFKDSKDVILDFFKGL
jgi:dolichol-phosphate mannosyltransferase